MYRNGDQIHEETQEPSVFWNGVYVENPTMMDDMNLPQNPQNTQNQIDQLNGYINFINLYNSLESLFILFFETLFSFILKG